MLRDILHNDVFDDFVEYYSHPFSVSTEELSGTIHLIATDARLIADRAVAKYNQTLEKLGSSESPNDQVRVISDLTYAIRYSRLAAEMEYLRDIRVPLLPVATQFEIHIDAVGFDSFANVAKGKPYSMDNLAHAQQWFANVTEATDPKLSKTEIRKAARNYYREKNLCYFLICQPDDVLAKRSSVAFLKQSEFGSHLLQQAETFGYKIHFVDMKFYNLIRHDIGKGGATAVHFSRKRMFVDISNGQSSVYRAIKLAHECGHSVQYGEHLPRTNISTKWHASDLEAHSIGCEYIVGGELLAAGVDPQQIHSALHYGLPSETVNLISDDPAAFISTVSQSEVVREGWKFTTKQTRPSSRLAAEFAKSMRPLCGRWETMPQPPTENEPSLFTIVDYIR